MSDQHGRLFDVFSAQASHTHGGSYFDAGFGEKTLQDAHGKLYDLFGVPRDPSQAHGQHFDEFGWHDMPALHGQHFDTDFKAPSALTGKHGTWFDVFRGGAEVRFLLQGADYEGTVIDCNREYATVRDHAGQTHEVELGQFLAFRTPTQEQAAPSTPASPAEAPSAHSHDAHGGGRQSVSSELPPVIQEAPQGQHRESRSGLPDGLMNTFEHLKSLAEQLDVEKDVDATETAAQGQPTKTVGHRANCPRGGSAPCGADVKGHCSLCNASVRDHEAVGKLASDGSQIPRREHPTSDHHSTRRRGTCPHCGEVIEDLDRLAGQGAPARQAKQGHASTFETVESHKCLGASIDVLKTLAEAAA